MKLGGGDTDALLRQMEGFARLWADPPKQQSTTLEETSARAARLFIEAFGQLSESIRCGDPLPEAWDVVTGYEPRHRVNGPGYQYVYPPGRVGPSPCGLKGHCKWLNPGAEKTVCTRCHTIRIRSYE